MKKILSILTVLFIIAASLISCSKTEDTEAPAINITSPVSNSVYAVGDTVFIKVVVTENDELHHIDAILQKDLSTTVWLRSFHSHSKVFEINDAYIVQADDAGSSFRLTVTADDHSGNESEAYLDFEISE
jgi:hypothetical protein